ncbi:MAG: SUMF1/EgtB/PvdO family nonheme iron enzyme [Bacteroidales bacterium]|nr:SUMF1/EgtB/PvdO family nonheme iron enzyme [Bacteroidales bacterium]
MKKLNRIIAGMAIVALAAGCAEEKGLVTEPDPATPQLPGTLVTVNAGVDTRNSLSKVGLSQPDNTLDLISKWQDDDVISVFARQDGNLYTIGNVTLDRISSDGRTCSFSIMLPGEIDTDKEYEVYGVCGAGGTATIQSGGLKVEAVPLQRVPLADLKAPMMFYTTAKSTTVEASFQHIGAYEVLHVINTTGGNISFTHKGYTTSSPWYYDAFNCYFVGSKHSSSSPTKTDGDPVTSALTVPAGKSASIVSWYVPNGGTISNAVLKATIGSTEVTSANSKTSGVVIKSGNAYHLYATWDGTSLKFTDQSAEYVEAMPSLSYHLSTSGVISTGESSVLTVNADKKCAISILLDGKEVKAATSASSVEYTLPTDNIGTYEVTLKASSDGFDAKDVTFTYTVRGAFEEATVKKFTIKGDVTIDMILVKGGMFKMGGTDEQGSDAQTDEFPVHDVSVSDFYMAKFELTREQYKAIMGTDEDPITADDKIYPQQNFSRNKVVDYITKLNEASGKNFRMPTEAEWEYAARGGQKSVKNTKYSGGDNAGYVAWYKDNSGGVRPVGEGSHMNELGIYDMSGNMWEFVSDRYGTYPEDYQNNPQGPTGGDPVVRGGGFNASASDCRVSRRYLIYDYDYNGVNFTAADFGLRLVLSSQSE